MTRRAAPVPPRTGGTGHYVEGERVFAPPHGAFDPDWVAGIVLDRDPGAGDRVDLARWALLVREAEQAGASRERQVAAATAAGARASTADAVARACEDFVAAYGV